LKLITKKENRNGAFFLDRLKRITRYFSALVDSFEIMSKGMDNKEFMKFRMALLPASGFQSAQYRLIEFHCTDLKNLVTLNKRESLDQETSLEVLYENVYWKEGAKDLTTQKKTLTLLQFEEQYDATFLKYVQKHEWDNLWQCFLSLAESDRNNPEIIEELKKLDLAVNVNWPLSHYKSAVRYLQTQEGDVNATGGTNWQKYLPPRFQMRIFFPRIWSREEKESWGKAWVEEALK
jgi:tryptophan 2,3-dioxygenase